MEIKDSAQLKHFQDLFRRRVERLLEEIDLNAPPVILASSVNLILRISTVLFGEELYRVFATHQIENERERFGLCQNCDVDIPVKESFPYICAKCTEEEDKKCSDLLDWLYDDKEESLD